MRFLIGVLIFIVALWAITEPKDFGSAIGKIVAGFKETSGAPQ